MKRVLHVMQSLQRSGMEMMLLCSNSEWRRRGYQCDVLATDHDIGPIAGEMRESGYGVYHIPFRGKLRYFPRASFVTEFYKLCRSNYDVVHIHTEMAPPVFALLAKLAGVRRIALTPHGIFDFHGFLRVRKAFERWLVRLLGGKFGLISEGIKKCEWERFRNSGTRISNWLDTERFRPPTTGEKVAARNEFGAEDGKLVIVSVGNCSNLKNHEALLSALKQIPPSTSLLYLHIGREQEGQPEREFAQDLGLNGRVRFLGSQADVLPSLWAADVFAMPSLHEGLGMSAIEAICSGTLAVLSDVPGLRETARLAENSILTGNSPEHMAQALLKVAALDPSERRRQGQRDSDVMREQFSIEKGVGSITQGLYQ